MTYKGNRSFGTLSSAPDGCIVEHIFSYVVLILSEFHAKHNENENSITNSLCINLNKHKPAEYSYFFHHQNVENETENTSTDFAVFTTCTYTENSLDLVNTSDTALVKFEAKRLSTTLQKKREREYVIGEYAQGKRIRNSGGIERFKNGRHGADVNISGLIGYIQNETISYWYKKINEWIQNEIDNSHDNSLIWDECDKLKQIKEEAKVISTTSTSMRKTGKMIDLRHIWINLV